MAIKSITFDFDNPGIIVDVVEIDKTTGDGFKYSMAFPSPWTMESICKRHLPGQAYRIWPVTHFTWGIG